MYILNFKNLLITWVSLTSFSLTFTKPEDQSITHMRSSFILSDLGQRSKTNLTGTLMYLLFSNFYIIDFNSFWVINHLSIFPYKSIRNKSRPLYNQRSRGPINAHLTPGPGIYILMLLYMYIAQGQGQTTPWGQMLMSTESPYHFAHLLQVLKQSLWGLDFKHVFFSCFSTCT